jgi:hypothetical protein
MAGLTESPTSAPPVARPAVSGPVYSFVTLGKALLAPITGPFRPRRTAERCHDVPLVWAFGAHVLSALSSAVLLILLIPLVLWATASAFDLDFGPDGYFELLGEILEELADVVQQREFWLILAFACCVTELGFLATACVLIGWGAADEPLKEGVRRAFRTVWLMTSLCFWGILITYILGLTVVGLMEWIRDTYYQHIPWHDQPFVLRHEEYFVFLVFAAASVSVLIMLLRAVTARPAVAQPVLDPMCEYCGYNLSYTPVESRCPECGEPAVQSIGGPRQPTPWEQQRGVRRVGAYVRSLIAAVFRPSRFFRAMPGWSGTGTARTVAVLHIALASLVCAPLLTLLTYLEQARHYTPPYNPVNYALEGAILMGTMQPFWSFIATMGFVGVTAGIAGIWVSVKHGRNLLVPVLKVFCYGSGIFAVWSLILPPSFLGMQWFLPDMYGALGLRPNWAEAAADCTPIALGVFCLYWWFCIHRAGIRQVVYANT